MRSHPLLMAMLLLDKRLSECICFLFLYLLYFVLLPILGGLSVFQDDCSINPPNLVPPLIKSLENLKIKGTVYLATEGYNGQCVVPSTLVEELKCAFQAVDSNIFQDIELNEESDLVDERKFPYNKLVVRRRPKALSDGLPFQLEWSDNGEDLCAVDWQRELQNSEKSNTILLDCRNIYESNIGNFTNAIPLNTTVFSESFSVLDQLLANEPKDKRILTYCTGGIRCVKVNAYLKQRLGFHNVGRLDKGIIGYSKWIRDKAADSEEESDYTGQTPNLFVGKNFIFNKSRLGTDHTNECTNENKL